MKIKDIEFISFKNKKFKKDSILELEPNKKIYPLVILNEDQILLGNENAQFILDIETTDLENKLFWEFIFDFYKKNYIILSKWWHQFHLFDNLEYLFEALGWSYNYKTKNEWEECSKFKKNSIILLNIYPYPISIIRLWDRILEEIQNIWLEILSIFPIKKNLLREIIQDLYDLDYENQKDISLKAMELAKKYQDKKLPIFPYEEIKDLIKSVRYPESYIRKKESYKLKKKLEQYLQIKNLDIILPEDLESESIEFKILLRNKKELEIFMNKISEPKSRDLIVELIEYVFEK
jgi:hypothetical protein